AALAAGAALSLLVSPYGLGVIGYYSDVLGSSTFRKLVTEWGSPSFPAQAPFFVLALAALWITARKPRRLSLFEHFALVLMLVAGLSAIRNGVWFALVAVMVVPRALDDLWPVGDAPVRRGPNIA